MGPRGKPAQQQHRKFAFALLPLIGEPWFSKPGLSEHSFLTTWVTPDKSLNPFRDREHKDISATQVYEETFLVFCRVPSASCDYIRPHEICSEGPAMVPLLSVLLTGTGLGTDHSRCARALTFTSSASCSLVRCSFSLSWKLTSCIFSVSNR